VEEEAAGSHTRGQNAGSCTKWLRRNGKWEQAERKVNLLRGGGFLGKENWEYPSKEVLTKISK